MQQLMIINHRWVCIVTKRNNYEKCKNMKNICEKEKLTHMRKYPCAQRSGLGSNTDAEKVILFLILKKFCFGSRTLLMLTENVRSPDQQTLDASPVCSGCGCAVQGRTEPGSVPSPAL